MASCTFALIYWSLIWWLTHLLLDPLMNFSFRNGHRAFFSDCLGLLLRAIRDAGLTLSEVRIDVSCHRAFSDFLIAKDSYSLLKWCRGMELYFCHLRLSDWNLGLTAALLHRLILWSLGSAPYCSASFAAPKPCVLAWTFGLQIDEVNEVVISLWWLVSLHRNSILNEIQIDILQKLLVDEKRMMQFFRFVINILFWIADDLAKQVPTMMVLSICAQQFASGIIQLLLIQTLYFEHICIFEIELNQILLDLSDHKVWVLRVVFYIDLCHSRFQHILWVPWDFWFLWACCYMSGLAGSASSHSEVYLDLWFVFLFCVWMLWLIQCRPGEASCLVCFDVVQRPEVDLASLGFEISELVLWIVWVRAIWIEWVTCGNAFFLQWNMADILRNEIPQRQLGNHFELSMACLSWSRSILICLCIHGLDIVVIGHSVAACVHWLGGISTPWASCWSI